MLLGVKGKVLEIDSKKILRPDPGLYSQYFPSYNIFREPQIFRNQILNLFLLFVAVLFLLSWKRSSTHAMLLGVNWKVLGIDS